MPESTAPCPDCGDDARQIPTETVRNMVEPFGNQAIEDDVQYRICKTQDCPVVYFADELDQRFETDAIRVRANFKLDADADPYPLCYCFGYDRSHVRQDIEENGETNIAEWITERVQAEECACRWKSPLGGCCLANVREAIDEAETEAADR
ncbi:MAG: hypothetical protein M8354_08280 [Halalkalicoccus sp.]|nr:hypothetical protein [Halalkalicoccus sp.]